MTTYWISELKRRRIFRVAAIYAVAAWAVVQGASAVLPMLEAPAWIGKVILAVIAFGFPLSMLLAWAFDITPAGIQTTPPSAGNGARTSALIPALLFVAVLALAVFAWRVSLRHRLAGSGAKPARSIAVLPFVNMSGDATQEYYSDGITEEILNALAQIRGLQVAGRTSSFAYKGKNVNLSEIGSALHVGTVLEGSVQWAGDKIRITAQLIDAATDFHLWSKTFDRNASNIFDVEDEISQAIADALEVKLAANATASPATGSLTAHELYLRGIASIASRGSALADAATLLARAVALDSTYAAAWAALSQTQELLPWYNLGSWQTSLADAEISARRALALDANFGDAHTALANLLRDRLQFEAARQEYEKAVRLSPSSVEAHNQYAQMLHTVGEHRQALEEERKAVRLDPLAPNPRYILATILVAGHRYDDAFAEFRTNIRQHPEFQWTPFYLALALVMTRRYSEAETEMRLAAAQWGENGDEAVRLVRALKDDTQRPAALALLDTTTVGRGAFAGMMRPIWYSLFGEREKALQSIERWARETETGELYSRARDLWIPAFDPLRREPRFQAVQRRLHMRLTPTPLP